MKYKRKKLVSALSAIAFLLVISSCGNSGTIADNEESKVESSQEKEGIKTGETPNITGAASGLSEDSHEPTVSLSEDELEEFTDLFNIPEYNGFLSESFSSPDKINWDAVLQFGAGISVKNIGEEEIRDYLKAVGKGKVSGDLMVVRKSDLGEYIQKHTALDTIPDDVLSWVYVAGHDSFYSDLSSSKPVSYTCVEGTKKGDKYELRFRPNTEDIPELKSGKNYGRWADRVLTLRMSCGEAIVESNAIQWDDYCDEEQTFDVYFPQLDSQVRFITYSVPSDDTSIILVKDGNCLTDLSTSVHSEEGISGLDNVLAVCFFDFDYDGMVDISVMGDSDLGKHALLYKAVSTENKFEPFADLDEKKMTEIGSDFTLPGIQAALLGEDIEYVPKSYQDMYARIAKVYKLTNGDCKYGLIQVDDSPDPGFVIDKNGNGMSLYTYENGRSHCLIYDYNHTEKNKTDAGTEEKIKMLDSYEEEYISGTMDYKTLISRLNG